VSLTHPGESGYIEWLTRMLNIVSTILAGSVILRILPWPRTSRGRN
jgi:hypothetical protein